MGALFITFEGGEGGGKTTQIKRLAGYLTENGYSVITTREPGGTPEAEKIRNFLVQREGGNWSPMAECLLVFAAREMHYYKIIKPALDAGSIVICDRFTDSTRAYQGYGHGLDLEKIEAVKNIAIGNVEPDLTFVMDISPALGLSRSEKRISGQGAEASAAEDRFEKLGDSFHEKIRAAFLTIAKGNPQRCVVIDASDDMDEISDQIFSATKARLGV